MSTYSCLVDPVRLRAISLFAARDDLRFYLNGVVVEWLPNGGPLLVATNGHQLAAIPGCGDDIANKPAPPGCPSIILATAAVDRALKAHGRDRSPIQLTLNPTNVVDVTIVTANSASFGKAGIDGKPIDWRKAVPSFTSEAVTSDAIGISGDYLALFAKASRTLNGGRGRYGSCLTIRRGSNDTPVLVQYDKHPDFLGIVMPMRTPASGELPSWLGTQDEQPGKAA